MKGRLKVTVLVVVRIVIECLYGKTKSGDKSSHGSYDRIYGQFRRRDRKRRPAAPISRVSTNRGKKRSRRS
jgi:hypothetical protein